MIDRLSFEQIAVPHMPHLYNYALKLTMNREDAKDLLQETYFKAYRSWKSFEQGTNIKGWLYRIMKNAYINIYRKKSKEPKKIEYDETHFVSEASHHRLFDLQRHVLKPFDEVFEDEIARSLESLPSNFRKIIVLSDVENLKYAEIAKLVSCPVGTVRSRLHRGRKVLQQKLLNYAVVNGYVMKNLAGSRTLQEEGLK
jgi:RNA polymerase sigma-70 factor (ECF subfamily)